MNIKVLSEQDFLEIRLFEEAQLTKEDPNNHYTYDSASFYKKSLFNNNGVILGAYIKNKLIAISGSMCLNSYDEGKVFFISKLKENNIKTSAKKVVFFNNTLVHNKYRGKGIQKKLREFTIEYYKKKGIHEFISTTSKSNYSSKKNLIKLGMT